MELYFVLAIMAFMIFGFMLNKWPFGLTTMICCILLVVTGVYNVGEAFSGFSSQNIILVAPMFAMSAAFSQDQPSYQDPGQDAFHEGKRAVLSMLIAFYAFIAVLAAFLPTTAMMLTCLMFLTALDDSGDITPTTMTIPALAMLSVWEESFPLVWAPPHVTNNAFYEGMVTDQGQLLQFL